MARRKARDEHSPEYHVLMEIVTAYDDLKNAERELKDARAVALQEAKAALKEVDESIHDSRGVPVEELPLKVSIITTCWQAYQETKAKNKEVLDDKSTVVKDAREALETSVRDSRQRKLEFVGDEVEVTKTAVPVNASASKDHQFHEA